MAFDFDLDGNLLTAPSGGGFDFDEDGNPVVSGAAPEGGFMSSVKQTAGSVIKGAGQAAADFIPGVGQDNAVKRYGQEVIDANPTAVRSLRDIADKPGTAVAEAAGNAGASIGGMVGARALGMGITAAAPLTGPLAPATALVGQAVAWLGPAAIAALPSFGGIRDKQIFNDPAMQDDWRAKTAATLGAAAVGAIESKFGPQNWALSAMTKEGRAALAEKFAETTLAKGVGYGALKGAAIEGAEELVQNPIEQVAAFENPTTRENLEDTAFGGAMGAIGGGVFGGAAGALSPRQKAQQPKEEPAAPTPTPQQADPVESILSAPDADTAIRNFVDGVNTSMTGTGADAMLAPPNDFLGAVRGREADVAADAADLADFRASEERNLQVARAQAQQEQQRQAEMDAIQATGTGQYGIPIEAKPAVQQAATLEAPTAMQLAMQKAREKSSDASIAAPSRAQTSIEPADANGRERTRTDATIDGAPITGSDVRRNDAGMAQVSGVSAQPARGPDILPSDITRKDGTPFQTASGARYNQRFAGGVDASDVVPVQGGFVVRPKPQPSTPDAATQPQATPTPATPDAGAAALPAAPAVQPAAGGADLAVGDAQPGNGALKPVDPKLIPVSKRAQEATNGTGPADPPERARLSGRDLVGRSYEDLDAMYQDAVKTNRDVSIEGIRRFFGEDLAREADGWSMRQIDNWLSKEATDESDAWMQPRFIDEGIIQEFRDSANDFDTEDATHLGRSIAVRAKDIDRPGFFETPAGNSVAGAMKYAKAQGWDMEEVLRGMRGRAQEWAGDNAPELFERLFRTATGGNLQKVGSAPAAAGATKPKDQRLVPVSKRQPAQTEDDLMAQELERLYQEDIKADIRQRLGLEPKAKEAKPKASAFRTFLREFGIKPVHAADITGESILKANNRLPRTFRKGGLALDELVIRAVERGFLTGRDVESTKDNGGANKLVEMIQAEIRGERQVAIEMASDDAQERTEQVQRMEIEGLADAMGLPYDPDISTDRLASMVSRVQRALDASKEPKGSLKTDRILRNAVAAAQRVEAKREQLEAEFESFASAPIKEQNALLDVFLDDDGNPTIVRQVDAMAEASWNVSLEEWEAQYGQADAAEAAEDNPARQAGAPDDAGAGQRAGNDQEDGAEAQRGSDEGQSEGLTAPTRADVLRQQADAEAEAKRREEGGDKPLPGKKVTGDTPDMFNTQGSVFDVPAESEPPAENTGAITPDDAANLERGTIVKDGAGVKYYAWSARFDRLDVMPMRDGKPVIYAGSAIRFALTDAARAANPEYRSDPLYVASKPEPATQAASILDAANVTGKDRLDILKDVKSGALTPDEVQAAYPEAKAKDRLTDAGEELIRNRRGKLKGLAWDDVSAMNDTLKVAQVIKSNVWPRPDYAKMVEAGAPAWKAAALKAVYDKIATAPVTRAAPTDADLKAYIETLQQIRETLTAELDRAAADGGAVDLWRTLKAGNVFGKVFPIPADAKPLYGAPSPFDRNSAQGKENNRRALLIGGNGAIQALQFNNKLLSRVKDLLADGFPAKMEAWQKSYEVRQNETRDNDVPEGERTGEPQQRFYVYEKGSRWRFAKGGQDGGYATQEQAEAFARTLVAKKKEVLPPSRGLDLADAARTGPDWRKGKDATAQDIIDRFGFRGVNLGEYVKAKQGVAQLHLNHVFDAFSDLADLLGVPPKAMSLNGTLGVAVGAQGSGKALAHFVPGVNEINITRDSGAGALAHEFGHAMDHYFATQHGRASSMAKRPYLSAVVEGTRDAGGVRPEVMDAMRAVMKTINSRTMTEEEVRKYMADQRALNQRRLDRWVAEFKGNRGADPAALDAVAEKLKRGDIGEHQETDVETNLAEFMRAAGLKPGNSLAANAFTAAYRLNDLADEARFMATHIPQVDTNYTKASAAMDAKKTGDGYWNTPWEKFARAFETFAMDALKDRQRESLYLSGLVDSQSWRDWAAETGKDIPYPAGAERLAMQQAFQKLVDTIQTREDDAGNVAMFSRADDARPSIAPAALRRFVEDVTSGGIPGVNIADTVADLPAVGQKRIQSEGMQGVRGMFDKATGQVWLVRENIGDEAEAQFVLLHEAFHRGLVPVLGDGVKPVLNRIYLTNKSVREQADRLAKELKIGRMEAIEEVLADMAGEGKARDLSGWDRLVALIRQFMEKLGFDLTFTDDMVEDLVAAVRREGLKGGVHLNTPTSQTDTPAFRKWFGDSKVVDAEGKPLRVYHGTTADFAEFKTGRRGAFFASSPEGASAYAGTEAGSQVMPAYLSISNPYIGHVGRKGPEIGDVIAAAKRGGHDGAVVTYDDFPGERAYVAFRPEQIKSAIGNRGTFDPENPDIRYSRSLLTGRALPQAWQAPDPSRLDDLIYSLQDKQIDTKRVVKAVRDAIGGLADNLDPYLQEELYHGRAAKATKDFLDGSLRPLMVDLQARGVEISDFEEYLHNRHAERRNVQVAKVNPAMPDGGSGIKTADARAYLAGLPVGKRRAYEALAKRVDQINRDTRALLVSSGLEKQETIDAWDAAYGDEYVPLMREEMDGGVMGIGQGFSVRGGSSKRAMGSDKPVADILANIALQREKAITRAEKRRIGEALYGMVLSAPNDDFWFAVDPALQQNPSQITATAMQLISMGLNPADAQSIAAEPTQRYIDPRTNQVAERINPALRSADNVLAVRIDGEDKYVFFNAKDERAMRMARSLKNLDADQLGEVMGTVSKMTRYFSAVNTQWNPIFGVVNVTRDIQTALLNLQSTPLKGMQREVAKHIGPALRGIYIDLRDRRAGKPTTSTYAQLWEEFQNEGGATGYRDMYANAKERAEAIADELKAIKDGTLKKTGKGILNWLSDYNESMENAVRVAAYKVGKEQGLSNQQAASIAKNLTTNFNRKGQVALQAGALYAFFNASVQGTARIAQTMFEGGKLSGLGKRILTGGLMLGSMQAMLLAAAGFDDDEPPDFVRERSLVLPIGGDKYISIPMPLGFHVIPNLARIPTEWALGGFKDTPKRLGQLVGLFADAFNPIGSAGLSLQTLTPTIIDPLAALTENRDFTGKPIAKQDFSSMQPTAGHTRAKDTATPWAKAISYATNWLTGGTDYKPGLVSPTPDQIDYLIGQVTGGVGREAAKLAQVGESTLTGEELPLYKIPLVGRFVGTTAGQAAESARFYGNIKEIGQHDAELTGLRADRRQAEAAEYLQDNPQARMVKMADRTYREVRKLIKAKRDAVEAGASKDRIKLLDQQITAKMATFNRQVTLANDRD